MTVKHVRSKRPPTRPASRSPSRSADDRQRTTSRFGDRPSRPAMRSYSRPVARPVRKQELSINVDAIVCGIKQVCQSCRYINENYSQSLRQKYQNALSIVKDLLETGNPQILPPEPAPKKLQYRCQFKLAVRKNPRSDPNQRFLIGLMQPESRRIVDIRECPLHHENLKRLIWDLNFCLEASDIQPYDETTKSGDLYEITARTSHVTGEVLLAFMVSESTVKAQLRKVVVDLKARGNKVYSAFLGLNSAIEHANQSESDNEYSSKSGKAAVQQQFERISGAEQLRERLCDLDFQIGPATVFQVNPYSAALINRRVEQLAGQPSSSSKPVAWDLFCGIGQLSLVMARLGYRVVGIDESPGSIVQARSNAEDNQLTNGTHFIEGAMEQALAGIPSWAETPDVITMSPSKLGLPEFCFEQFRNYLAGNASVKLIYVSREMESLARDLQKLLQIGFKLRQLEAFDMVPQTEKLEWVAILTH